MGILGTDFTALHDPRSPEQVTRAKGTATRKYEGPWDERWEFAALVLGREIVSEGPPITIYYENPLPYPDAPWLFAMRVEMEGKGASYAVDALDPSGNVLYDGEIAYDLAEVTIYYESLDYDVAGDEPYLDVELRGSDENLTVEGAYKFATGGQAVPGPVPIPLPRIDFSITAHRLPEIRDAWFDLVGHVNNAVWRGRDEGTVLFQPSEVRIQRNSVGEIRYAGNFNFSFRRVPWNYALNPYTGLFEEIETLVGGYPPVPSGDFDLIFG